MFRILWWIYHEAICSHRIMYIGFSARPISSPFAVCVTIITAIHLQRCGPFSLHTQTWGACRQAWPNQTWFHVYFSLACSNVSRRFNLMHVLSHSFAQFTKHSVSAISITSPVQLNLPNGRYSGFVSRDRISLYSVQSYSVRYCVCVRASSTLIERSPHDRSIMCGVSYTVFLWVMWSVW